MPDFFESMNANIPAAANLAMKKMELDIANQRWQDQLAETKRQHSLNTGLKLLETGDFENASTLLRDAVPGLNPETFTQSPGAKLKQAQTDEAMRALLAKNNIRGDIQKLLNGTEAVAAGRNPEMLPDEPTPTGSAAIPGQKDISTKDYLNILMKHDPESAATLKALSTQTGLESAKEKLEWMYKMLESKEKMSDANNNTRLLIAAINAANKGNKAEKMDEIDKQELVGVRNDKRVIGLMLQTQPGDPNLMQQKRELDRREEEIIAKQQGRQPQAHIGVTMGDLYKEAKEAGSSSAALELFKKKYRYTDAQARKIIEDGVKLGEIK